MNPKFEAVTQRYSAAHPRSQELFERVKKVMPGGVKGAYYHPPFPLSLERGEGQYLWDVDGHRYLDLANHHTAQVLGHNHPAVMAAIASQMNRGVALGASMGNEVETAEEMCRRVPSLDSVRFCNSGTEATLHAVRLAREFSGKPKIAKFEGGYHGNHDGVEISVAPPLDRAGPADAPVAVPGAGGMAPDAAAAVVILPYDDEDAVERIVAAHAGELACIMLDPKAGVMPQRPEFARAVEATARRHGLILLCDEIVGFRVGTGGIQEQFGIRPDLSTYGKIVGGGFPVGAFGGRRDIMDLTDNSEGPARVFQSGTHSGHALAMAAGRATLDQLTPEAFVHVNGLTERLCAGVEKELERAGIPGVALHDGSVFSIYFTAEQPRCYRSLTRCDKELNAPVFLSLLNQGYFLSHNIGMNAVSLPTRAADIDGFVEAFGRALAEVG